MTTLKDLVCSEIQKPMKVGGFYNDESHEALPRDRAKVLAKKVSSTFHQSIKTASHFIVSNDMLEMIAPMVLKANKAQTFNAFCNARLPSDKVFVEWNYDYFYEYCLEKELIKASDSLSMIKEFQGNNRRVGYMCYNTSEHLLSDNRQYIRSDGGQHFSLRKGWFPFGTNNPREKFITTLCPFMDSVARDQSRHGIWMPTNVVETDMHSVMAGQGGCKTHINNEMIQEQIHTLFAPNPYSSLVDTKSKEFDQMISGGHDGTLVLAFSPFSISGSNDWTYQDGKDIIALSWTLSILTAVLSLLNHDWSTAKPTLLQGRKLGSQKEYTPYNSYYSVTVDLPREKALSRVRKAWKSVSRGVRQHGVRGHWRTYRDELGKVITSPVPEKGFILNPITGLFEKKSFISAHRRGNADLGVIRKDYVLDRNIKIT